jgi:ATP-dependent Clp protease ATP-binding subunit ClpC
VDVRRCIVSARERARTLGHDHIGTEHLLLALLDVEADGGEDGLPGGRGLIESFGVTAAQVEEAVEALLPTSGGYTGSEMPFSAEAKEALEASGRESRATIGTTELVLGLLQVEGGVAARVLRKLGVDLSQARRRRKVR